MQSQDTDENQENNPAVVVEGAGAVKTAASAFNKSVEEHKAAAAVSIGDSGIVKSATFTYKEKAATATTTTATTSHASAAAVAAANAPQHVAAHAAAPPAFCMCGNYKPHLFKTHECMNCGARGDGAEVFATY